MIQQKKNSEKTKGKKYLNHRWMNLIQKILMFKKNDNSLKRNLEK